MPNLHHFQTTQPDKPILLNLEQVASIQKVDNEVLEVNLKNKQKVFIYSTMREVQQLLHPAASPQADTSNTPSVAGQAPYPRPYRTDHPSLAERLQARRDTMVEAMNDQSKANELLRLRKNEHPQTVREVIKALEDRGLKRTAEDLAQIQQWGRHDHLAPPAEGAKQTNIETPPANLVNRHSARGLWNFLAYYDKPEAPRLHSCLETEDEAGPNPELILQATWQTKDNPPTIGQITFVNQQQGALATAVIAGKTMAGMNYYLDELKPGDLTDYAILVEQMKAQGFRLEHS